MSKVDKIIEEIKQVPEHNTLNKKIAIALCEVEGIDPNKEVYAPAGGMIPAWEYVVHDANKIRQVAIKLGWIKNYK